MSAALLAAAEPLDVCTCGDYRRDHPELGCRVCVQGLTVGAGCARFELWMPAAVASEEVFGDG